MRPAAGAHFALLGITDRCSRCGRPYAGHAHDPEEAPRVEHAHAFRSQPVSVCFYVAGFVSSTYVEWTDGRWDAEPFSTEPSAEIWTGDGRGVYPRGVGAGATV